MNNSEKKDLIRRKGFDPVERAGDVAIRRGDKVILLSQSNIQWLVSLKDKIEPKSEFSGIQPQDYVQIFTPMANYKYWGMTGVVLRIRTNTEFGALLFLKAENGDEVIVHISSVHVYDRPEPDYAYLAGKTRRERDRLIYDRFIKQGMEQLG